LANKNNISAEQIVCGAGSDEIISLITAAFAGVNDEIIYSEHGFLMYPISAMRVGAVPIKVKESNLKANINEIIKAVTFKTKIIFIANPNNPTGSYLTTAEILELISKIPKNILIVLDHAYEEFVEAEDYPDALDLAKRNENVIVTRTFSKIYGLASLRIGWCYCSKYIAEILNKIRGPFNVSGPAQICAKQALLDEEFLILSKKHNQKWLKILFDEIANNPSMKAYPSIANFILIDFFSAEKCSNSNRIFLENNMILREMNSYGLPSCLRLTIGNDQENYELIRVLKKF
jgi:histidinol-phosphate aminotransferase